LSLSRDVIEPSDSSGLVEFIGIFAGGHQLRLLTFALGKGKCSSAGNNWVASRLVAGCSFHPPTPNHD
jgi:hypothetical protein